MDKHHTTPTAIRHGWSINRAGPTLAVVSVCLAILVLAKNGGVDSALFYGLWPPIAWIASVPIIAYQTRSKKAVLMTTIAIILSYVTLYHYFGLPESIVGHLMYFQCAFSMWSLAGSYYNAHCARNLRLESAIAAGTAIRVPSDCIPSSFDYVDSLGRPYE